MAPISRGKILCNCRLATYVTSVASKSNLRMVGATCAIMKDKMEREPSRDCTHYHYYSDHSSSHCILLINQRKIIE
jgi:hypothetical protein